ncbi:myosin heavy chain, muscle-like isoform X2 [Drosophila miranda]|uniref:myosin heavy chain, muscle-like isoform X2 n=1 Tax=Drosophila miranda TaxID=7229 RepID=UPI0007E662B7|nr:myosin heavy chain, muscle-like isoform X2 [Drosophila miranda]
MSTSTVFVRSTKASDLRAKANNLRASNESQFIYTLCGTEGCNLSICSMPSKLKDIESCSGSVDERMSLPETPQQQAKISLSKNSLAQEVTTAVASHTAHQWVLIRNRARALQAQYQSIQCLQAAFFEKLQSLGPEESKMIGSYKLVAIVLNEDRKWVHKNEDPNRLLQNLPIESVQDLKNRCQGIVDSGFMMLYDHLAKDELESCNQKEKLTVKLKDLLSRQMSSIAESIDQVCVTPVCQQVSPNKDQYSDKSELREQKQLMEARLLQIHKSYNGEMIRLKADLEEKLKAVEENWQQTVVELKQLLRLYETQNNENLRELAQKNNSLTTKDNTIASMKAEMENLMSRNTALDQLVKESEAIVLRAQKEVERNGEYVVSLENKLKVQQQKRQNGLDQLVVERDQIIADLKLKVLNDKQFKNCVHRQKKNTRKLQAGNAELDIKIQQTRAEINELEDHLRSTTVELDSSYQREQQLHSHLKDVKTELFRSEQLVVQMREEAKAVRRTNPTPNDHQQKIDQLCFESAEKDKKINKLTIQLESKGEQLRLVCEKLSRRQKKLKCMENSINLLTEQNIHLSELRNRHRENEFLMEREISKLMGSIKVYQDHISNNRRPEQSTELNGYYCIDPSLQNQQTQENFQLHGTYFRPLHSHLARQQQQQYVHRH